MNEEMKIRTTLSNPLLKQKLFKGFFIALVGVIAMVSAGIFLPGPLLSKLGLFVYIFGFGLITIGLLPYRKLSRLQNKPNELRLTGEDRLEFWAKGQCRLIIPIRCLKGFAYTETENGNGITFYLNHPSEMDNKTLKGYQILVNREEPSILFLYFSKRSCEELQEAVFE